MADRLIQNYLSSGEASEMKIGGTEDGDLVVTKKDIEKIPLVPAYCSYTNEPNLTLTSTFQKVTGWSELITPVGIVLADGDFTALISGVYQWNLERIYQNFDSNTNDIIKIFIEIRKNGNVVFSRDIVVNDAKSPQSPTTVPFNSPFIFDVEAGDVFNIYVRATDGVNEPDDTRLIRAQLSANKIYNV